MFDRFIVGAVIAGLLGSGLAAQAPRHTFDVASVKRRAEPLIVTGSALLRNPNVVSGNLFSLPNVTVAALVQYAWEIRDFQVVNGPKWMWNDRFEVQARAASDAPSPEQVRFMVQSLLEDRFGLAVHREQREMRYFALVPARTDGRLGPYLQRRDDCRNSAARMSHPQNLPPGRRSSGCGPLSQLATTASRWVDIPIIDATGLDGTFDFFWFLAGDETPTPVVVADAMEDFLGLTLEATRGPVTVLVIDSLQQPTEN
ncbi:MAG TPA: TIGR03435 family protein [Gemmatimonadales bacterium]|nr:TIGR03435 family protein [Gemmatimonadales bacterium]